MTSYCSKVSVVIPVFNAAEFIGETIHSLKRQTYENWECFIVDDGSNDDTVQIVSGLCENDSRIKLKNRPSYLLKGANSCRNYGLELATGEFVQWFDADDLMHPEMLKKRYEVLQGNDFDFVISKGAKFKDEIRNIVGYWDQLHSDDPLVDQAIGKIDFQTNAGMFRRDFLNRYNLLWNEKLSRKQDYEFFSRTLSESVNFQILDEVLFYYRLHSKSMSVLDSKNSIESLVKADLLVFKILKHNKRADFFIQRHFIRKSVGRLNRSFSDRRIGAFLLSLWNIIKIFDWRYLKNRYERRS
jgi:glycosyltransferase involved in cell wall biosynthesis